MNAALKTSRRIRKGKLYYIYLETKNGDETKIIHK